LSVVTTSKAYQFKHTVDPIDPLPENQQENEQKEEETEKNQNQS
jgi:hypothetical protein